ncbi:MULTISPECIES: DUF6790 family protein [unclassified Pseudodesulfovibrio]|uniref:DUF6790 family protein n=1 Tax=unclassified Pseudodesulfovibrio TaxID=2661612 RepID=UPI000FEB75DD|nr:MULTISPECIES: DUF6790 family protein [unclassified Pseudodesulfovibrio]MCJ2164721.1 hypothetical protein [Pseudodesulfovibrio sp. S3-i]RWU04090.1 hypothetical protein DWB63_08770 [Pseudodesulfovibrio sp. S3]
MYVIYLAVAGVAGAVIHILVFGSPVANTLLAWLLGVKVGLGGIWAFMGHYFKSDEVAEYIGWPSGSPFQKEIAFANLALGICGVLSFVLQGMAWRYGFWLATMVFASIFLGGAFSVHVKDIRKRRNTHPGNAGPVFFADILAPMVLWALFLAC